MTFKFDENIGFYYFDNLLTSEGERIYVSSETYELYTKLIDDGSLEQEARYRALASCALTLAKRAQTLVEQLTIHHQAATYDRAMKVVE